MLRFSLTAKFLKQSLKQIKTLDFESSESSSILADQFKPAKILEIIFKYSIKLKELLKSDLKSLFPQIILAQEIPSP